MEPSKRPSSPPSCELLSESHASLHDLRQTAQKARGTPRTPGREEVATTQTRGWGSWEGTACRRAGDGPRG